MEVSDNTNTEVVETIDNSSDQVDSGTSAGEVSTGSSDNTSIEGKTAETPEWKPNYKIKAYDKEFEIPETFRSFINKDNEKDFRDAFEKAYALDVMKEKNVKIREMNEGYQARIEKELAPKLQRYEKIEGFLKKNDLDSFFENVGMKDEILQKWMLQKLQLRDLPPEQQALYNDQRAAQLRAYQLEEENSAYKQQFAALNQAQQQAAVDNHLKELDGIVSSPAINDIAKNFDSRLGQDGSFKLEVLRRAAVISKQRGSDMSVKEAVDDFLKVLGQSGQITSQDSTQTTPQAASKPTLPSLSGKATSPATQKIKSLDDLKKLSRQMTLNTSRASRE